MLRMAGGLSQISDRKMRIGILCSLVLIWLFILFFPRLFLPTEMLAGGEQQDYLAFYGAARATLTGDVDALYDKQGFQDAIGLQTTLLWLYPPTMLVFIAPFGLLDYGVAKTVWALITLAGAFGLGRLVTGSNVYGLASMISPVAFAALYVGQISVVFALLLVMGLMFARSRPIVAGLCIAVLTVKPQYGLLVIPFLVATRAWKALGTATLASLILIAASVMVVGTEIWREFFDSLVRGMHVNTYVADQQTGRITLSNAIIGAGFGAPPAVFMYVPLFLVLVAALTGIRCIGSCHLYIAFVLAAGALAAPYLLVYDFFIFNAAIL